MSNEFEKYRKNERVEMSNVVKIDEPNTDSSVHTRLNSHFTPFVAN